MVLLNQSKNGYNLQTCNIQTQFCKIQVPASNEKIKNAKGRPFLYSLRYNKN